MKYFFGLALILLLVSSCQKSNESDLRETIYVRNEGADMPAYVYGNGASQVFIVLLHGGPGGNGLEYRFGNYYKELEERYAMVYWDQRGQGMSQGNYPMDSLNLNQMTDDLEALISVLKERYGEKIEIVLLGHSWGGMLGTSFMIDTTRQETVIGWIEASGAHDFPRLNRYAVRMFKRVANEMLAENISTNYWTEILDWIADIDTANISHEQSYELNKKAFDVEDQLMEDGFIAYGEFYLPTLLNRTNKLSSAVSGRITNALLASELDTTSLTAALSNISKPCLFLWGAYDFVTPLQLGQDAFALVSSTDKKLVVLEESGHTLMRNEGEIFTSEIVDFVERIRTH